MKRILDAIQTSVLVLVISYSVVIQGADQDRSSAIQHFDYLTVGDLLKKTVLGLPECGDQYLTILLPARVPPESTRGVEEATECGFFNWDTAFRPGKSRCFKDGPTGVCISVVRLDDTKVVDPQSNRKRVVRNACFRLCNPSELYRLSLSDTRALIDRFHCWILCEAASAALIPLGDPSGRFTPDYRRSLGRFWAKCLTDSKSAGSIRGTPVHVAAALGQANRWSPAINPGDMHLCELEKGMILRVRWTGRNTPVGTVNADNTLTLVQSPYTDRPVTGAEEEFCVESLAGDGNPFVPRVGVPTFSGGKPTPLRLGFAPAVCPDQAKDSAKPFSETPSDSSTKTLPNKPAEVPIGDNEKHKIASNNVVPVFERKHLLVTEGTPAVPEDIRSILLARPSETWLDYDGTKPVPARSPKAGSQEVLSPRSRFILAMFRKANAAKNWCNNQTQPAYCQTIQPKSSLQKCDAAAVFGNLAWVEPLVVVWVNNRRCPVPVETTFCNLIPPSLVDFAILNREARAGSPAVTITFWQIPHDTLNQLAVAQGDTLITKTILPIDAP